MKSGIRVVYVLFLFFVIGPPSLTGQVFYTDAGSASFISRAPMLEFEGKSSHLTGIINTATDSVDFYLDLNTLDTGIDLRNRHMRESYLETDKFPFAEFTGTFSPAIDLSLPIPQQIMAVGNFTMHGVTKSIQVPGTISPIGNDELLLVAEWTVKLSDYNIRIPRVVFYELSEIQTIRINARLKRN